MPTIEYGQKLLADSGIPAPSYRHAAPSAPWPWVDIDDGTSIKSTLVSYRLGGLGFDQRLNVDVDQVQLNTVFPPVPAPCDHKLCRGQCWKAYPKSRFPNWTDSQVERSGIAAAIREAAGTCTIYHVDIDEKGIFAAADQLSTQNIGEDDRLWDKIITAQVSMDFVSQYYCCSRAQHTPSANLTLAYAPYSLITCQDPCSKCSGQSPCLLMPHQRLSLTLPLKV